MLYAWKLRFWGCSGDLFVAGGGGGLLKGVYSGIVGWGGWIDLPATTKATMVKGAFAGLLHRILVDLSTSSMSPNFLFTFRNCGYLNQHFVTAVKLVINLFLVYYVII